MNDETANQARVLYQEVCRAHNGIADFRAKLLALLPIASGAGIFLLVGDNKLDDTIVPYLLPVGVFGALVTVGLYFYELRGILKCLVLIEAAEELEKEINIPLSRFGAFNVRETGPLGGLVGARGAALIIYPAVISAWGYVAAIGWNRDWSLNPGADIAISLFLVSFVFGYLIVFRKKGAA